MLDYARDWVFPKTDAFKVERELSDHVLSVLNPWFIAVRWLTWGFAIAQVWA
ncbi:hypothetical protein [Streptomyces lonegramiae]|uniref:Uncharacterized protein n=1 Tax=Streptomyces lonegramiae TaxID=3075524 RepID=A0ABU2XU06_9ACTN|nr:hypothetical protein [Streptomyces sp. DSM 41529]MDT0549312.1 hypothetical protein [Streptomyces sp. DSM 41529]